ncbi:transcript elongation factor IIS [Actinidia rufa]|uniref:Transcript elongation factor IIS n=1 Tax=Actinidia rufa TaxID=165716 RepID=A0A7J0E992_9ERIC|nr:transcript elongation factor IIS [Actinidia rufa]
MERELVELFDAAKKAADAAAVDGASSKVDRCLDVLNQLKNFPVSYDVLVSTQVAKRLRPLTKHPAEQIQVRVGGVLEIWKKIIIDEASRKKNDGIDIRSPRKTDATEKPGSASRSETIRVEKKEEKHVVSRSETIKVEKKVGAVDTVKAENNDRRETVKAEKIPKEAKPASSTKKPPQASNGPPKLTSLIKCNDATRDKIRELLLDALSKVPGEADEDYKDEVDCI